MEDNFIIKGKIFGDLLLVKVTISYGEKSKKNVIAFVDTGHFHGRVEQDVVKKIGITNIREGGAEDPIFGKKMVQQCELQIGATDKSQRISHIANIYNILSSDFELLIGTEFLRNCLALFDFKSNKIFICIGEHKEILFKKNKVMKGNVFTGQLEKQFSTPNMEVELYNQQETIIVNAMVDTGAFSNHISTTLIKKLGFIKDRNSKINSITFQIKGFDKSFTASFYEMTDYSHTDILIGKEFLNNSVLFYNGVSGNFEMSFLK